MNKRQWSPSLIRSLITHGGVALLLILIVRFHSTLPIHSEKIDLQLIVQTAPKKLSLPAHTFLHQEATPKVAKIDLRPGFMREGLFTHGKPDSPTPNPTQEMLTTPFRVVTAFDHLASQVDRNLDFPDLFVENGVQGTAVLDLHFNAEGKVDESESHFSGSHHAIRGLLVKAVRLALVEWYKSDAYRLNRDQFKSQHFRTELDITYTEAELSGLTRLASDTYQITRRRLKNTCAVLGAVDLVCLALKAKGAVDNIVSDKNRILFEMLKDRLDHYDDIGLRGINQLVSEG